MIVRLAIRYLLLFAIVIVALSIFAYVFVGQIYAAELQPALGTPEYAGAYAAAMGHVAASIALFDLPLLLAVGGISYLLARAAIAPLLAAREREKRFAAEAAHELRSPLATIATVAQAIRQDAHPDLHPHLETIARTALDASAIVADLLTLAREPGSHALQMEPLDLAIIARQCVDEFSERANTQGLSIEVQTQSAVINGDERRIRELLRNLLDNAMRHARAHVYVRTSQAGKTALLSVEDDGAGIEPPLQERIFERFYRASSTGEGLGLGLSIGRWIALAHGGDLLATGSTGASGATFILRLPAIAPGA